MAFIDWNTAERLCERDSSAAIPTQGWGVHLNRTVARDSAGLATASVWLVPLRRIKGNEPSGRWKRLPMSAPCRSNPPQPSLYPKPAADALFPKLARASRGSAVINIHSVFDRKLTRRNNRTQPFCFSRSDLLSSVRPT